jgi:hypothetical protein
MRKALIQPDKDTAIARNRQAYSDDTSLKRGGVVKSQRELAEDGTLLLWAYINHISDGRVALWVNDTDSPNLTTEEEKAAMLTEEEAVADGFYVPDSFKSNTRV